VRGSTCGNATAGGWASQSSRRIGVSSTAWSGQKEPLFDGVNFKAEAGWEEFDPASGTLVVRADNKDATLAALPNTKLEAGKSYTFVLVGTPGKLELIKIEDAVAAQPE
jgi:hypothetical protein